MTQFAAAAIMSGAELGALDIGKIACISILGGSLLDDIDFLLDEEMVGESLLVEEIVNGSSEVFVAAGLPPTGAWLMFDSTSEGGSYGQALYDDRVSALLCDGRDGRWRE